MYEAQEDHQLYNGEATLTTTEKGVQVKKVNDDAKVLILYVSNLILFSKKSDAVKAIDEYGEVLLQPKTSVKQTLGNSEPLH